MAETRTARVLAGQDEAGAPVFQPTCLEHDRQWFGPTTHDVGTASFNAHVHDVHFHPERPREVLA